MRNFSPGEHTYILSATCGRKKRVIDIFAKPLTNSSWHYSQPHSNIHFKYNLIKFILRGPLLRESVRNSRRNLHEMCTSFFSINKCENSYSIFIRIVAKVIVVGCIYRMMSSQYSLTIFWHIFRCHIWICLRDWAFQVLICLSTDICKCLFNEIQRKFN